jgi:hypothetical protein
MSDFTQYDADSREAIKSFIDKMSKEQIKAINEFVENMEVDNE